jgi:hypothetical protein
MPKLSFEFSSLNELHGFCTEFVLNWAKAAEIAKASKAKEVKEDEVEEKPKKVKVKEEEVEDKPLKKAKVKEEEENEDKVTFDQVRAAMLKLDGTDEEETIPAILEKFGVERISALKEKDFQKAFDLFTKAFKRSSPSISKD